MVAAVAAVFLKFAAIFFTDGAKPDFNTAVTVLTRLSSFHQKPPGPLKILFIRFCLAHLFVGGGLAAKNLVQNIPANLNSSIRQLFIESR